MKTAQRIDIFFHRTVLLLLLLLLFFFTLGINDPEGFEKKVRLLENGSGHYSVQSVPKES